MSPEVGCLSCGISTIRATAHQKEPHTGASRPGEHIFLDILHPLVPVGLTPSTTYAFYLILVDAYSRYVCIYGMLDKTTTSVINVLQQYQADHRQASGHFGYLEHIECIRADAGSQFTAHQFSEHCRTRGIHLMLAAPKKQYQNHLAERTWQTVSTMGRSLLVHARLPDTFMFSALVYVTHIFNILPVRGLLDSQDIPSTPYQLFFGHKPTISDFRVFGCPTVVRRWVTAGQTNGKQTERGICRIFIDFATNQKGYMIFAPASQKIMISDDVIFDESFTAAIATTWQQHPGPPACDKLHSRCHHLPGAHRHRGKRPYLRPISGRRGERSRNHPNCSRGPR